MATQPLGFKNAEGRGFLYSDKLAKQAGKMKLVPVTDEAELKAAMELSSKGRADKTVEKAKATPKRATTTKE